MAIEILTKGKMEFEEVLKNHRKEQLSQEPFLRCIQTEDLSLLATRLSLVALILVL